MLNQILSMNYQRLQKKIDLGFKPKILVITCCESESLALTIYCNTNKSQAVYISGFGNGNYIGKQTSITGTQINITDTGFSIALPSDIASLFASKTFTYFATR